MNRTLVTRKATGLGSDLISVVGALHYAQRTSRRVIVDWRRSRYLEDSSINLFDQLFEVPGVIEGVPISTAASLDQDRQLPQPIWFSRHWSFEEFHQAMLEGVDRGEPTIIVTRPMHHLPVVEIQRAFLSGIRPRDEICRLIEQFQSDHWASPPVGVHIRHGSGERLESGRDALISAGINAIVDRCLDEIFALGIAAPRVFLCTDSQELADQFQQKHPDVVKFATQRSSDGPLHTARYGLQGAIDAVAEMWLLARCSHLVFNPSWFSHYARIMGEFEREPVNLDPRSKYGTLDLYIDRVDGESESD